MSQLDCLLVSYLDIDLEDTQRIVARHCDHVVLRQPFSAAVAYLGTYLFRQGLIFDYICCSGNKEQLKNKLLSDIRCVSISTTFIENIETLIEIIRFIKIQNPTCKIVVGGAFIARTLHEYKNESQRTVVLRRINADFYINSFFGEEILAMLVKGLKYGGDLNWIPNLYILQENDYYYTTSVQEVIKIQDHTADWQIFQRNIGLYVPFRTSVSCPFHCAFCSFPINGGQYQSLSEVEIADELINLSRISSVGILNFIDDSFNIPNQRFKTILQIMIEGQFNFQWHSFFRCCAIDDETIWMMKKSGCMGIMVGIESGSPQILKNMNKEINLDVSKHLFKQCKKAGILTYAMFIVGFPGETAATIQQTINYINESGPDFYALSPWCYITSAPIHTQRLKYGLTGQNNHWRHNTMHSGEVQQYILNIYQHVYNSTLLAFNYTFLFQLLYHNVPLKKILEINKDKVKQILQSLSIAPI